MRIRKALPIQREYPYRVAVYAWPESGSGGADGHWRWLLSDAESGTPVADHLVDLDPGSAEVARFADLYGYARAYAAPDRRVGDEARIVAEAGAWAGRALLG